MSKGGGAKAAAPAAPAVPTAPPPEPVRSEAAQAAAAGMFGKLTRKTEPWAPEPLLCKRLNVPVPAVAEPARQEGRGGGGVGKRSWESTMTFNDALLPLPQLDAPTATGTRGARQAPPPPPPPPPPQAQHGQARAAADALLANLSGASSSDGTAKGPLSAGAAAPAPSPAAAAASAAMEEDADDGPEARPPPLALRGLHTRWSATSLGCRSVHLSTSSVRSSTQTPRRTRPRRRRLHNGLRHRPP